MKEKPFVFIATIIALLLPFSAQAQNDARSTIKEIASSAKKAKDNGDYVVATRLYNEALSLAETSNDLIYQYAILGHLVNVYLLTHDTEKGVEAMARKAVVSNKIPGVNYESMLIDSMPMPLLVAEMGSLEQAMECIDIIDAMAKKLNTDFGYGLFEMTKGQTLVKFKMWQDAAQCLRAASEYYKKSDNEYSDNFYERSLQLLASCLANRYLYEESLDIYNEVLKSMERTRGTDNIDYAEALQIVANITALSGDIEDGARHYINAWEVMKNAVTRDLNAVQLSEMGLFWKNLEDMIWSMASFGLKGEQQQNQFTSAGYEALMFGKGFLLAAERSTGDQVKSTGDLKLIDDYQRFCALRSDIDKLTRELKTGDLASIYAQIDSLDKNIMARLSDLGMEPVVKPVSAKEIADALSDGEAVVDFTDFKALHSDDRCYAAYVMRKGWEHPQLLHVFEESEIMAILDESNGRFSSLCNKRLSPKTMSKVWEPLMPYLKGIEKVYFVPAGILYNMPVESIMVDNNTTLGEKFNIIRLTSSKEIINYSPVINDPHTATLYGALEYDVEPEKMTAAAKKSKVNNHLAMRGGIDAVRGDSVFRRLKTSEAEVLEIDRILSQKNIVPVKRMYTEGTEESFFAMHGDGPDILLLSTHGFFYSPGNVPPWSSLTGYDNAMYLTGLVMSGGNAEWMGRPVPAGVCGGLLTSADISKVDLAGTQLAVLSACETGLGQTTNEGVYGLQRAFKKAGVKSMVMSLWPVADRHTTEFMVEFFNELTLNNWDKRKSFLNAQRKMRQKYSDPYYWASFVILD